MQIQYIKLTKFFSKLDRKIIQQLLGFISMGNVLLFLCMMFFNKYSISTFSLLTLAFSVLLIFFAFRLYSHNQVLISLSQDLNEYINDPEVKKLNLSDCEKQFFSLINFKYNSFFICIIGLIFSILGVGFSAANYDQFVFSLAFSLSIPFFSFMIFVLYYAGLVNKIFSFNLSDNFYLSSERLGEIYDCICNIKDRVELEQ